MFEQKHSLSFLRNNIPVRVNCLPCDFPGEYDKRRVEFCSALLHLPPLPPPHSVTFRATPSDNMSELLESPDVPGRMRLTRTQKDLIAGECVR